MYKLLLDEPPLVVFPSLARLIGLNEAIILQQVHYWIVNARETKRAGNFKEGRWWVYHSYPEWAQAFPFWSEPTIKRIFLNLEKTGLLLSAQHADDLRDRRKWYTIDYDQYASTIEKEVGSGPVSPLDQNDPVHGINLIRSMGSKWSGVPDQNDPVDGIKLTRCYKETKTTAETTTKTTAADTHARKTKPSPEPPNPAAAELVAALVREGVNRADALRLAQTNPDECRRQLDFSPFVADFKSTKGAYLRSAIEGGYGPPKDYEQAQQKKTEAAKREKATKASEVERCEQAAQRQAIETARAQLMQDEALWAKIQAQAEAQLPPLLRGKPGHVAYRPALETKIGEIIAARQAP